MWCHLKHQFKPSYMRRLSILLVFVFGWQLSVGQAAQAQDVVNLFEVKLTPTESENKYPLDQKTNKLLYRALKAELIRLTGSASVIYKEEARPILKKPKRYLKNYRTQPRKVDGVIVGEEWVFEFNAERLYEVFQRQGLIIWPAKERPVTLVYGSINRGGEVTLLTRQTLKNLSVYQIEDTVNQFGLKMKTPVDERKWIYPSKNKLNQSAAVMLAVLDAKYLLTYQFVQNESGKLALVWTVYDKQGRLQFFETNWNKDPNVNSFDFYKRSVRNVFKKLTAEFSEQYRNQASVLGSVTLFVEDIDQVSQLSAVEDFLASAKPTIHQAKLTSLKNKTALFEVDYQGAFSDLMVKLNRFKDVKIISQDAFTGQVSISFDRTKPSVNNQGQLVR